MTNRSILVVDDSAISRKILRSCLPRDREFVVVEAGDGASGLERFREHGPDITFLDLTMPGMSGLDCLAEMMALRPTAIVLVVTADVQARSIARALESGAMEVLPKPPTREAIGGALARAEGRLGARGVA